MPAKHGYFKSFDGTKLFYHVEGNGKPLVFCYGLVCSSLHWAHQIQYFKSSHQTIYFDYRGHHHSDVPENLNSLTIENSAKDLVALLDELNINSAVLLGHSMGANVVLEFYKQHPNRVKSLVLANGTPKPIFETSFNLTLLNEGFKILKRAQKKFPNLVSTLWNLQKLNPLYKMLISLGGFNPHLTPQKEIDLFLKHVSAMDPRILITLLESYSQYNSTPWLHTVKAPTLIVAGEKDKLISIEQQELLRQLIPGSKLEIIKHGSHCPQMDLPDLVNHKIENFIFQSSDKTKLDFKMDQSWVPGVSRQSVQGNLQSTHC